MARSTFKILFYLKRQAEQNGKAPSWGVLPSMNDLAVQL